MKSDSSVSSLPLLLCRLIVVALAGGSAAFVGFLLVAGFAPRPELPFFGDFMTYAALGVGLIALFVNVLLAAMARRSGGPGGTDRNSANVCLRCLCGAVVFAFAAFFAAAALMLEQSWGALILATAMILGVAARFPLTHTFPTTGR